MIVICFGFMNLDCSNKIFWKNRTWGKILIHCVIVHLRILQTIKLMVDILYKKDYFINIQLKF